MDQSPVAPGTRPYDWDDDTGLFRAATAYVEGKTLLVAVSRSAATTVTA